MQQPYGGETTQEPGAVGPRTDWSETADEVAERAEEVASEVARGARRIADDASQSLRGAKRKAAAAYGRTSEAAERAYRGARGYAIENPGTAVAVTFAAGLGVGMILASRNSRPSYGRGLVPVVAMAVVEAVRGVFDRRR
jgi:ElaB/YqjD/DUF883 family membrane-anchored ribosome-binding protein